MINAGQTISSGPIAAGQSIVPAGIGGSTLVANGKILVIDLDSDIDDLLDLAISIDLADQGDITLLAVVITSSMDTAAPCARAMLDWAGYQHVPVGAWQGGGAGTFSLYNDETRDAFRPGDVRQNYEDGYRVIRRALLQGADGTVDIIWTGTADDVSTTITSIADDISPLTGAELLALKCRAIISVAGFFDPATLDGSQPSVDNANVGLSLPEANIVAAFTGCPVIWNGLELADDISDGLPYAANQLKGRIYEDSDPLTDPFRFAWNLGISTFGDSLRYRMAVSSAGIRYSAFGAQTYWTLSEPGDLQFQAGAPYTLWTPNPAGNNRYMLKTAGKDAELSNLNEYQCFRMGVIRSTRYIANGRAGLCRWEYLLADGASATTQVLTDTSLTGANGQRGADGSATATDPAWTAEGLDFDGADDRATAPSIADLKSDGFCLIAVVKPDTISGTDQIITRSTAGNQIQVRLVNGVIQVVRGSTDTIIDASGALTAGQWVMITVMVNEQRCRIRRNGVTVHDAYMVSTVPTSVAGYLIGGRASASEWFDGAMGCLTQYRQLLEPDMLAAEAQIRAAMLLKGISV